MQPWKRRWRGWWTATLAVGLMACGDSTSTGGGDGGNSTTSSGGATSATTSNGGGGAGATTSSSTGGTTSGGAAGASGGSGGASGGSGGASGGSGGASGGSGGASGGSGGAGGCSAPADCDDGAFCNGVETCSQGVCVAGTSPCDDGISCTNDTCNEAADSCAHAPVDALCDNGIACDGAEICNAIVGCLSLGGTCDDGIGCTADYCDAATGQCMHQLDDGACSDNLFCNGVEQCDPAAGDPVTGCVAGTPVVCTDGTACTSDFCNEATNACENLPNDAACSDNLFCNGQEVCVGGIGCVPGVPPSCDDNRTCTADSCDNATAACLHVPNHAACSDGLDCNGQETCSSAGPGPTGCLVGTPIPCGSDGILCTLDACNEVTDQCEHTPLNAICGNGQFCVPAAGGCTAAQPCNNNAECDDGNACNGVETCNAVCQPGTPIVCSDNIACTVDSCNPATGMCVFAPVQAACDDGAACNGVETCVVGTGCMPGTPVVCSDGVMCTQDVCAEPSGTCLFVPNNDACSDDVLCNGIETCTPNGCVAGTPYVCPSDGVACTEEVCDPILNACQSIPDNSLCPCGQTCSSAQGGCGNFCQISTCQGKVYQCGDCLDNDNDCGIDSADTQCLGPCDNTEDGFYGGIPGQNNSPCKSDCYFDQDTGSGNDDCYWSHKCDPLEVPPNYPPEGSQCAYNPNANIPGYPGTCSSAFSMQSAACLSYCGPLTPNGCDCFGCCAIPGAPTTVWLGSENPAGTGSCNLMTLNDPTKCKPCTQVQACLNTCEVCEICIGKPDLPPGCVVQDCPVGAQPCGEPGQAPCGAGYTCITGCCQQNPV